MGDFEDMIAFFVYEDEMYKDENAINRSTKKKAAFEDEEGDDTEENEEE